MEKRVISFECDDKLYSVLVDLSTFTGSPIESLLPLMVMTGAHFVFQFSVNVYDLCRSVCGNLPPRGENK